MDVAFILDMSGSTEVNHERAVQFAKRVIYGLDMNFERARIGLVTFGDDATTQFELDSYRTKEEVINAMSFLPNKGRTNTQAALSRVRTRLLTSGGGARNGVPDVAILVTDGHSNVNEENTIPEATRLKDNGAALYVVAIGDEIDLGEINEMAGKRGEPSQGYVYRVLNDDEIDERADELAETLCDL